MNEPSQQEFLKALKNELSVTWDELAVLSGIKPRALKTYRMPAESKDFRALNDLAKNALIRAVEDNRKKSKRA
jgi:hypothetical protein